MFAQKTCGLRRWSWWWSDSVTASTARQVTQWLLVLPGKIRFNIVIDELNSETGDLLSHHLDRHTTNIIDNIESLLAQLLATHLKINRNTAEFFIHWLECSVSEVEDHLRQEKIENTASFYFTRLATEGVGLKVKKCGSHPIWVIARWLNLKTFIISTVSCDLKSLYWQIKTSENGERCEGCPL